MHLLPSRRFVSANCLLDPYVFIYALPVVGITFPTLTKTTYNIEEKLIAVSPTALAGSRFPLDRFKCPGGSVDASVDRKGCVLQKLL